MIGVAAYLPEVEPRQRVISRDEAWFTALYRDTVDRAFLLALKITNDSTLAEDAVADAYLRAWRSRSSFRGPGAANSWLFSITRNCAFDVLRARKSECDVTEIQELGEPAPVEVLFSEQDSVRIHEVFQRLTAEQQQVITLRFFEELPHGEVAKRMKRSANAVRAIQFRALSRMRNLLEASVDQPA